MRSNKTRGPRICFNVKKHGFKPGMLFRAVRAVGRLFYPARSACALPRAPVVYVCRHDNLMGPVKSLLWLDEWVRPWVLHVFCARDTCYRHFRDYTLTVRFGWPRALAIPCAWVLGLVVPAFMRSMGAIEVERDSARALITLRETVRVLTAGQSVILYPDIEYDAAGETGALYDGYLLLSRLYRRAAGQPLAFVPTAVAGRSLKLGTAIHMSDDETRQQASERMRQALALLN